MTNVVIVGDGDAGPIPKNLPELQTEFEPGRRVFFVIVALIACKENEVGVMPEDVAYVVRAQAAISA